MVKMAWPIIPVKMYVGVIERDTKKPTIYHRLHRKNNQNNPTLSLDHI